MMTKIILILLALQGVICLETINSAAKDASSKFQKFAQRPSIKDGSCFDLGFPFLPDPLQVIQETFWLNSEFHSGSLSISNTVTDGLSTYYQCVAPDLSDMTLYVTLNIPTYHSKGAYETRASSYSPISASHFLEGSGYADVKIGELKLFYTGQMSRDGDTRFFKVTDVQIVTATVDSIHVNMTDFYVDGSLIDWAVVNDNPVAWFQKFMTQNQDDILLLLEGFGNWALKVWDICGTCGIYCCGYDDVELDFE